MKQPIPKILKNVIKLQTTKKQSLNIGVLSTRINNKNEYRAHVKSPNGKIIIGTTEGYKSREGLENNLKKLGILPSALPKRIPRLPKLPK